MKEFIDKLISRLEETKNRANRHYNYGDETAYIHSIEIVNQLAEEYKHCTLCYLQSPCEYQNENAILPNELLADENDWIPCSERLPSRSEVWIGKDITDAEPREFIVMVKGAYYPTTGYYTDDGWVKDIYNKENGSGYGNEIIAWRFFPAPYQPKGE